jgi:hypothetical protein
MATEKQIDFFKQLTTDKQFPDGTDIDGLRAKFANVPDKSASDWIEKAMTLPDKGEVPPPF